MIHNVLSNRVRRVQVSKETIKKLEKSFQASLLSNYQQIRKENKFIAKLYIYFVIIICAFAGGQTLLITVVFALWSLPFICTLLQYQTQKKFFCLHIFEKEWGLGDAVPFLILSQYSQKPEILATICLLVNVLNCIFALIFIN
ncbi:hypothetical protein RFI_04556 [Reticulomyxa filosa]|uniref:Uncharacterized protein n=1 Tax=Reticulomyxa filosa TaxID=46433 RepID=X6P4Q1_RETFI|nr:hypothetical protein RFI_04556 [Reticulomyxa filosa]|eukprot:ETO32562.1 hypothetical protein RFI_04556 [Reticulomyxa filosa]